MARLLRMPEIAAGATEAILQDWSVEESDRVSAQEPVATVETEKAVVDIEAEADGVILKRLVPPGSRVEIGAPIAVLGDPGEETDDLDALLEQLGVASAPPASAVSERPAVPDDPEGGTANTGSPSLPEPELSQQVANTSTNGHGRIFTSPLARRLAQEAGLSLEEIQGSGPRGRILRRDVDAAVAERASVAVRETALPGPDAREPSAVAAYTDIPHSRMRQAIAARLTQSKQTVPHFYVRATVDAHRLVKLRAELNDGAHQKVSLNDLVVKAVARAHVLVDEMNVTWSQDAVRKYTSVDVAVAVATDRGLLTPVLRSVESMSVTAVSSAVGDVVERARSGQLRQEELEGGSITVTNLGMFRTDEFAAIINPPQAAILAVGAVTEEAVVRKRRLRIGPVLRVTLSVDHRPVDGVVAARWMRAFVSLVERPAQILA